MRHLESKPNDPQDQPGRTALLGSPLRLYRTYISALRSRPAPALPARQVVVPRGYTPLSEVKRFSDPRDARYDSGVLRRRRWFDLDRTFGFVLVVVIPTVAAIAYYGTVAAARFVSDSEFVLRTTGGGNDMSGLAAVVGAQGGMASSGPPMGGDRDAQAVAIYIGSPDGMAMVDRTILLREVFARPEADALGRYPGLLSQDTNYALYKYWQQMVTVSYDPGTSVITLRVRSFRPEDSKAIGEVLLTSAESLVNRMDSRVRKEAVRVAQEQVHLAREQVVASQGKLTAFRLSEQVIDPFKMSAVVIETISQLVVKNTFLKAELSNLLRNTPATTQARILQNQIASLDDELAAQQLKLTGKNGSLSPLLAEYARLSLQSEFANRTYTASMELMEAARAAAGRQQVFLERISGPTLSDYSTEPFRTLMILMVLVISFCVWSLLRFTIRNVWAHHGR